jgi:hypothetical protein
MPLDTINAGLPVTVTDGRSSLQMTVASPRMNASSGVNAIKFLVGSRTTNKYSWSWRLGVGGTSFYIKPIADWAQDIKISLHGPDPARGKRGGYKIALEPRLAEGTRGGKALVERNNWPDWRWYPGREVHPAVDLVLRLRFPWDLFDVSASSADIPPPPKARDDAFLIPAPERGYVVDVELFVCHKEPYWPNESKARLDNACLGPLTNKAGQHLTGLVVHHPIDKVASPVVDHSEFGQVDALPLYDRIRGLGTSFDFLEYLWIQEMWLSRSRLAARQLQAFRPPEQDN